VASVAAPVSVTPMGPIVNRAASRARDQRHGAKAGEPAARARGLEPGLVSRHMLADRRCDVGDKTPKRPPKPKKPKPTNKPGS